MLQNAYSTPQTHYSWIKWAYGNCDATETKEGEKGKDTINHSVLTNFSCRCQYSITARSEATFDNDKDFKTPMIILLTEEETLFVSLQ